MTRISVLSTTTYSSPPLSYGGEAAFYFLSKGLCELGHDVTLYGCPGSLPPHPNCRCRLRYIPGTYSESSYDREWLLAEWHYDEVMANDYVLDCSLNHPVAEWAGWYDPEHQRKIAVVLNGTTSHTPRCGLYNTVVGSQKWKELLIYGRTQFFGTPFEIQYGGAIEPVPEEAFLGIVPFATNCFPAGSTVSTPTGPRVIESLSPGDLSYGRDGPTVITRVHRRWFQGLLTGLITPHSIILATPEHPLARRTPGGLEWVNAARVVEGDILVYNTHHAKPELATAQVVGNGGYRAPGAVPFRHTTGPTGETAQSFRKGHRAQSVYTETTAEDQRRQEEAVARMDTEGRDDPHQSMGQVISLRDDGVANGLYMGSDSESSVQAGAIPQSNEPPGPTHLSGGAPSYHPGSSLYRRHTGWGGNTVAVGEPPHFIPHTEHLQHQQATDGVAVIQAPRRPAGKPRMLCSSMGDYPDLDTEVHRLSGILSPSRGRTLPHCQTKTCPTALGVLRSTTGALQRLIHSPGEGDWSRGQNAEPGQVIGTFTIPYAGWVYNLTTSDHTYTIGGFLVHNCDFYTPGESPKENYLLFLSRPTAYKGLAQALELVGERKLHLKIVPGLGHASHSVELEQHRPQIEAAIARGARVDVIAIPQNSQHHILKRELYRRARALLAPVACHEPFGLTLIEAMACGTPVIASRMGAFPEIIKDGVTGLLCRTKAEYLEAIDGVRDLPDGAPRADAESRWHYTRAAKDYLELLQK